MYSFASSHGSKIFGFGQGRTYCTNYATTTLLRGSAKLKYFDIDALLKRAQDIVGKYGIAGAVTVLNMMRKQGPTGDNVIDDIEERNRKQKHGVIKGVE